VEKIASNNLESHKFGHTQLSIEEEEIPWKCRRLVIGTGTGALPVMEEVKRGAHQRKIELAILPTAEAIKTLPSAGIKSDSHEISRVLAEPFG
jgi:hypothetical protein